MHKKILHEDHTFDNNDRYIMITIYMEYKECVPWYKNNTVYLNEQYALLNTWYTDIEHTELLHILL